MNKTIMVLTLVLGTIFGNLCARESRDLTMEWARRGEAHLAKKSSTTPKALPDPMEVDQKIREQLEEKNLAQASSSNDFIVASINSTIEEVRVEGGEVFFTLVFNPPPDMTGYRSVIEVLYERPNINGSVKMEVKKNKTSRDKKEIKIEFSFVPLTNTKLEDYSMSYQVMISKDKKE